MSRIHLSSSYKQRPYISDYDFGNLDGRDMQPVSDCWENAEGSLFMQYSYRFQAPGWFVVVDAYN